MNLTLLKNAISGAIGYGYVAVEQPTALLQPVKSVVMQATPTFVSQGVIDQIVSAIAAVAIAALSRWVVGLFDKKKKVEIVATVPIEQKAVLPVAVEKQPDSVTINDNPDGSKEKESPQK